MSWVGKIPWRRDRLPTPIFLGFPYGSAGKESACNSRDLGSIPGKIPWRKERLPTLVFWPGKYHRPYSLWGRKESDTTEWLSLFLSRWYKLDGMKVPDCTLGEEGTCSLPSGPPHALVSGGTHQTAHGWWCMFGLMHSCRVYLPYLCQMASPPCGLEIPLTII